MNILILAAGKPVLDPNSGAYPLCLAEIGGQPLIERILAACKAVSPSRIIVAIREGEAVEYHLDRVIRLLTPDAEVLRIKSETAGAACTALLAAGLIDNEEELLIISANELVTLPYSMPLEHFRAQGFDAATLVFKSVHPRYSYVRLEGEQVLEASEKTPLSFNATAGFYWFAKGSSFVRATKNMIIKDGHVGGRFYVCPTFNELILEQKRVGSFRLSTSQYHPVKTGNQLVREETLIGEPLN